MSIKTFTAAEKLTAADTNEYLANSGLVFVKQVTIGTAVATVNVTSCFTSTYDNYVISISNVTATANGSIFIAKLLSNTTPVTSGVHANTFFIANGAAGGLSDANLANASYFEVGSISTATKNSTVFTIEQPFLANYTRTSFSSADDNFFRLGAGVHRSNTSFDGVQISPFSGTITGGTITVYGYRKA